MKRRIFTLLFIMLFIMNYASAIVSNQTNIPDDKTEKVSRLNCLKDVIQVVLDEKNLSLSEIIIFFFSPPFNDISTSKVVDYAYSENITYGVFLDEKEADYLTLTVNQELHKKREEYYKKNPDVLISTDLIISYDLENDYFVDEKGNRYQAFLFGEIEYSEGYHFFPNRITTINECVAFMVRCINNDKAFKDLDVVWDFACNNNLVLPSDSFYLTPNNELTQEVFSTLLSRFKKILEEK